MSTLAALVEGNAADSSSLVSWLVATYGVTVKSVALLIRETMLTAFQSSKIFLNLKEVGLQTRMPLSMTDNFAGTQSMPRFRILDAKQVVRQ